MILKDILPDREVKIMVRTYDPFGDDILFGYCKWDGNNLISLDGDNYYLDEEVIKYEYEEDGSLTYWFESEWL